MVRKIVKYDISAINYIGKELLSDYDFLRELFYENGTLEELRNFRLIHFNPQILTIKNEEYERRLLDEKNSNDSSNDLNDDFNNLNHSTRK